MKRKVIAINALSALWGGGQLYISNLVRYAKAFPDIEIYVFAPPQFCKLYAFPAVEVIPCSFPAKSILHRTLWERWKMPGLLRTLGVELVFCPGGTINFSLWPGCLTAVAFQNMLIFDMHSRQKYPLGYMRCRFALLEGTTKKSFKKANLVLFVSEYAKNVVAAEIPDRKGSSAVIPHGLDETFKTAVKKNVPRLKSLPKEDYLLYVSLIEVYKAHVEVVQAYHLLCQKRETKEKLLLVGPEYAPYAKLLRREIQRLGLESKVIITGCIPHADMPSVYHHAKAHIFASCCENCPNIVLESLGSGRPLFLSNRPPMPEVGVGSAVYFDPYKPQELADLLSRYLDDEQWMKEMGRRAFERSLFYSWETTARRIFQAFEDLFAKMAK